MCTCMWSTNLVPVPPRVLKYFIVRGQTLHGTFHFTICSKNYKKKIKFWERVGNRSLFCYSIMYSIESDIVVIIKTQILYWLNYRNQWTKILMKGLCVYTNWPFTWYYLRNEFWSKLYNITELGAVYAL